MLTVIISHFYTFIYTYHQCLFTSMLTGVSSKVTTRLAQLRRFTNREQSFSNLHYC